MKYRLAENSIDFITYASLRESVGWCSISKEQATPALKNSLFSVVVFDKDNAIGMGRVIGDGIYFTIADVVVCPEYQGEKVGTLIIDSLLNFIDNSLPSGSRGSIQLISEFGKEGFYEKFGFKRIPHEHCGPALRKIIYKP